MSQLNVFYNKTSFKNVPQKLDSLLSIYSILNFPPENKLVRNERKVLIYYLMKGLTQETLDTICEDLNYKKNYLHQVNKKLRDKGYLVRDERNTHKFYLIEDLKRFRKKFIEDNAKGYIISFSDVGD